jgi:hypothetical protein
MYFPLRGSQTTCFHQSRANNTKKRVCEAYHLVVRLEALQRQILGLETLMRALSCGNNRGVTDERVVDSRVRNQVSLKFVQIDIQRAVETEG